MSVAPQASVSQGDACSRGDALAGPRTALGVYISYPFCEQKCTYCNFASGVFPEALAVSYLDAICAEIEATDFSAFEVDTVYFGGGTPSLLNSAQIGRIFQALPAGRWAEATIEAAPGSITAERAEAWAANGIGRVSLGVQSFIQVEAAAAGRKHSAEMVARELELLRGVGISDFSIDLIAGLARQTAAGWEESLDWVERLEAPHASIYMLEVDDESRLGEEIRGGGRRYGAETVPTDEEIAELYLRGVERLAGMGLEHYEISNFARPGRESRHNLKYWTMRPYFGFGADAHSFDGGRRWSNVRLAGEYVERVRLGERVRVLEEEIDGARLREERFFTGLRLRAGLEVSGEDWGEYEGRLAGFLERGWLEWRSGRLRLTGEGVLFSNEVFEVFV